MFVNLFMDYRTCTICGSEKELTDKNFYKDKSRYKGFGYNCKPCEKIRGLERYRMNPRRLRYMKMSKAERKLRVTTAKRYRRTVKGRVIGLYNAYVRFDRKRGYSDPVITREQMQVLIQQPCVYCGDQNYLNTGCDRKDNRRGHSVENVVPCCTECNRARADKFSFEEMKIIGAAMSQVKLKRKLSLAKIA